MPVQEARATTKRFADAGVTHKLVVYAGEHADPARAWPSTGPSLEARFREGPSPSSGVPVAAIVATTLVAVVALVLLVVVILRARAIRRRKGAVTSPAIQRPR